MWKYTGKERPDFADSCLAHEESVWDYPRPPICVDSSERVIVEGAGGVIADSRLSKRVLETASPPTYYIPVSDVDMALLRQIVGGSFCEWKGKASYWALLTQDGAGDAVAWSYEDPRNGFEQLRHHIAFYPGRVACYVDGERVSAQAGGFYGGWVTARIVGPCKGDKGTEGW